MDYTDFSKTAEIEVPDAFRNNLTLFTGLRGALLRCPGAVSHCADDIPPLYSIQNSSPEQ
jgi:hypothetical protein